uniref:DUF4116 domain-containing protein n=1 Tax=Marseillevirus LCMAC201 TaxID=2506605 RepID=A0A481YXD5_9VIRU|nr:MAG: protein of unknown function DUF4116 [Marseillevirus LCMAC201]
MFITTQALPDLRFFKLTNLNEIHHGFHYTTGLNIATKCSGGLDFIDETQIKNCLEYTKDVEYIREATFPKDTQIYREQYKYKCDKFILEERKRFYLDEYLSKEEVLAAVQQNSWTLDYIKEQTEEICLAAVQQNGVALRRVHHQTPKICKAAVQQNGWVLEFVKEKTADLWSIQFDAYQLGRYLPLW